MTVCILAIVNTNTMAINNHNHAPNKAGDWLAGWGSVTGVRGTIYQEGLLFSSGRLCHNHAVWTCTDMYIYMYFKKLLLPKDCERLEQCE